MFDYSLIGDKVITPDGPGQYLSRKNGKVLVVMDWDCPPVEYDGDTVYLRGDTRPQAYHCCIWG